MKTDLDFPELRDLAKLVHEQRRKRAGRIRITEEEHALGTQIDQLLEQAGVEVVACQTALGTFEVRRAVARSGNRYATVTPIVKD